MAGCYKNVTPRLDALGEARPFVSEARGLYMAEVNAEKEGHSDLVTIGAVCKGAQSEGLHSTSVTITTRDGANRSSTIEFDNCLGAVERKYFSSLQ